MKPMLVKMQQNWALAKGDQEQFKAGVSFQEYVSCDNDAVTCKVQTLEKMTDEESTYDISEEETREEDNGWESELLATFLSTLEGGSTEEIHNVWCFDNRMTVSVVLRARCAVSGENEEVVNYFNPLALEMDI